MHEKGLVGRSRNWTMVETATDRLYEARQQTLPPSSLSRFLIPSRSLPPPPGPFLFVLLRAKPCRSFRRHAFNDVDGRGSATIGASEPHPHFTRSSAKREKNWRKEGREGFLLFWPRTRASTELFYGRGRAGSGRETGGGDG